MQANDSRAALADRADCPKAAAQSWFQIPVYGCIRHPPWSSEAASECPDKQEEHLPPCEDKRGRSSNSAQGDDHKE